jgi:hypothetical protein
MSGRVTEAVSASSRWSQFFPREGMSPSPGGAVAAVPADQRNISHGRFFDSPVEQAASDHGV